MIYSDLGLGRSVRFRKAALLYSLGVLRGLLAPPFYRARPSFDTPMKEIRSLDYSMSLWSTPDARASDRLYLPSLRRKMLQPYFEVQIWRLKM